MKYFVDLNGERTEVELVGGIARIGSEATPAALTDLEGAPVSLVTLDSDVHRAVVRRGSARGSYTIWIGGYRFAAEALDERARAILNLAHPDDLIMLKRRQAVPDAATGPAGSLPKR